MASTLERFHKKIVRTDDGCWQWTATTDGKGYGFFYPGKEWPQRQMRAHRFAYIALQGPIPTGYDLDHLCRNLGCCNPDHLEPVPHRENVLRGISPIAQQARQTHCKKGHPFSPENTYQSSKGRVCRICARERNARYMDRKRGHPVMGRPDITTHCPAGHPYANDAQHPRGHCPTCRKERGRRQYRMKHGIPLDAPPQLSRKRTHCMRGHLFTEENTYHHPNGTRICRECLRESKRRRRQLSTAP